MHPALRKPFTKVLLAQSGKALSTKSLRFCADKCENIEIPPEPTTCCMSGCTNCVWIEYAETLSKLLDGNTERAREIILSKISDPNLKMFLSFELQRSRPSTNTTEDKKL